VTCMKSRELRGGFLPWHFDLAYVDRIITAEFYGRRHCRRPAAETGFIDRIAVLCVATARTGASASRSES